jgi:hypothetical protein
MKNKDKIVGLLEVKINNEIKKLKNENIRGWMGRLEKNLKMNDIFHVSKDILKV